MTSAKRKKDDHDLILCHNLSDVDIKYFTGFKNCAHFQHFLEELINFQPSIFQAHNELSVADQLISTLMKIKHNYDDAWMKTIYKLNDFTLKEIFKAWVNVIYKYFMTLDFWKNRVILKDNFTCVICTLNIKFREGKQLKPMKYLISLDSLSHVCYNSKLYQPSIPNHQILLESGILEKLDPSNDIVSIDKSYNAVDLLKEKKIRMSLPKSQKSDSTQSTVYKVKQNKITMDILQIPEEELAKVVMVSNMIFNYIRLTE